MNIKKVLVSQVVVGMKIAKDIYDEKGLLVLKKDTILDQEKIQKLSTYNIRTMVVYTDIDDSEQQIDKKENFIQNQTSTFINEHSYFEKLKSKKEFGIFEQVFNETAKEIESVLNDIVTKSKQVNTKELIREVKNVIQSNRTGSSMLNVINCLRGYDDQTYMHSMNVALICNIIAEWMNMSDEDCDLLILCGVLHDIGKIKIPKEIIMKPSKLTQKEYDIIKLHPVLGYQIVKDFDLDERVKNAILMHHERYNGTGYPNKYAGNQIDKMARIVAIADVYDAMTADRVYREGMCPFDVIEYFEKDLSVYDPKIVLLFLRKIAESYISNKVLLSNGEEGIIVMINQNMVSRPVIMIHNQVYDLSKISDLKIKMLL